MSWLLFMDESGHDHKQMPYEVRGGIALHAGKLWSFINNIQRLEREAYGVLLSEYRTEIKGSKLLDRDRFKWASQLDQLPDEIRRSNCRKFLTKGLEKKKRTRIEFTAYGQASLEMARGVFEILNSHDAVIFGTAIPKGVPKPPSYKSEEFLRKDFVFLFERFFYFLEFKKEHGLLILDETDKSEDRRFVQRIERYFRATTTGRHRTSWIVPTPLFVSSDMAYPVQAADLCIYCINWGLRLPQFGMDAVTRTEIENEFSHWLKKLQYHGDAYRDGQVFEQFGIVYVHDPYTSRTR